jgi:hypothetical protein
VFKNHLIDNSTDELGSSPCGLFGVLSYLGGSKIWRVAERPEKRWRYRHVWSAAELQAKNEEWQLVCANVFGLQWSQ